MARLAPAGKGRCGTINRIGLRPPWFPVHVPLSMPAGAAETGRRENGSFCDLIPPLLLRRRPGLGDPARPALEWHVNVIATFHEDGLARAGVRGERGRINGDALSQGFELHLAMPSRDLTSALAVATLSAHRGFSPETLRDGKGGVAQ